MRIRLQNVRRAISALFSVLFLTTVLSTFVSATLAQAQDSQICGVVVNVPQTEAKVYTLITAPDKAYFWSGLGPEGHAIARRIALENGGMTLETCLEANGIVPPAWDMKNTEVVETWQAVSKAFSDGCSGTVRAILGKEIRAASTWYTIELPALYMNPNVKKIVAIDPETGMEKVIFCRGGCPTREVDYSDAAN